MRIIDLYHKRQYVGEMRRAIREQYNKLPGSLTLSSQQEREILEYWRGLTGVEIGLDWHRYFYRRTGLYSPRYVPSDFYYSTLIGKFNHFPFSWAYTDKNLTDCLLPGIKKPETILKNERGYFYINNEPVSPDEALASCRDLSNVIIKPSFAAHGESVRKLSISNGRCEKDGKTVEQLFGEYKSNFLIQSVVRQHKDMAALNPSSVNTIRILTYRSGMEVLVLYTVIRIGRSGQDVDNESAGGISTKIYPDGTLAECAYGASSAKGVSKTDSGVVLKGYHVPSYDLAVDVVRRSHLRLPYFDLVGWDIAIEEDGEPVLIEWNTWPELSQSANGPAFGDYTERVIREIWERKNTRNENW